MTIKGLQQLAFHKFDHDTTNQGKIRDAPLFYKKLSSITTNILKHHPLVSCSSFVQVHPSIHDVIKLTRTHMRMSENLDRKYSLDLQNVVVLTYRGYGKQVL